MPKIVLYTENYFPGGLERFIFDFIKSKTFDVHILVNSENDRVIDFAKKENIPYTVVNLSSLKLNLMKNALLNKFIKVFNFFSYYISMILNYFRIKKDLNQLVEYENIIIVNGGYPAALSSLSAVIAAKKLGFKKVGLSILSSPSPNYKSTLFSFFQSRIDSYVGLFIDFYIPNSNKIKSELISQLDIKKEKIKVVYTGVNILDETVKKKELKYNDKIIEKENYFWITMVALLGSTKRQDILIRAISKLDKNIKLILAGDGPKRLEMQELVFNLGLSDRVLFLGWTSNADEVYQFCDLNIFISDQEGLPYSISEAMSHKLPIIASSVGGIPEQIIDSKGGLLLKSNNVDELVEKINYLKNEPNLMKEFSEFSIKKLKTDFSIESMNNQILKLYKA